MTCDLHKVYFYVKIQLILTAKSDQDPDPHGPAWIRMDPHWFGAPWIRIRIEVERWIRIRIVANADPKYCPGPFNPISLVL
jgi:hypothetical protein